MLKDTDCYRQFCCWHSGQESVKTWRGDKSQPPIACTTNIQSTWEGPCSTRSPNAMMNRTNQMFVTDNEDISAKSDKVFRPRNPITWPKLLKVMCPKQTYETVVYSTIAQLSIRFTHEERSYCCHFL